jgi:hypothetical protein
MPLNQSVMIQLRNIAIGSTNGSGVIAGVIPCDPSSTLSATFGSNPLFPEWSDWSALFQHVKCVQLEVKLLAQTSDEVKGDVNRGLVVAGNLQNITVPSNYGSVADNGDSQIWNPLQDQSSRGLYHAIRHRSSIEWASSSTPSPSSIQYVGCPGGIAIYGDTLPASLGIILLHITGTYKVSSRT